MIRSSRLIIFAVSIGLTAIHLHAAEPRFTPETMSLLFGGGANPVNGHGHSVFHSVQLEVLGRSPRFQRWIGAKTETGFAVKYSDVRQPRSWFGHTFGDPDDSVRAESAFFFLRRNFTPSIYGELGTGPMWSNRRVPAATSRFNFESQGGFGLNLFATGRHPLRIGYRFSHISNGGVASRNPGLDVHSFLIGTRIRTFRLHGGAEHLQSSEHQ
jgi:hypothetical protein